MADAFDPSIVGSILQSLPIDHMIYAPLDAMIKAQVRAAKSYADFIMSVGIRDGKAVQVQFQYEEVLTNTEGEVTGTRTRTMSMPLLAAVHHPCIAIEEGSIDFELTVSQSLSEHSETAGEGGFDAKIGWGPFSVNVHGKVSHKSEQTRKTDTSAKYSFHVAAKRQDPPEAMQKVIDHLVEAAIKPAHLPGSQKNDPQSLINGGPRLASPVTPSTPPTPPNP